MQHQYFNVDDTPSPEADDLQERSTTLNYKPAAQASALISSSLKSSLLTFSLNSVPGGVPSSPTRGPILKHSYLSEQTAFFHERGFKLHRATVKKR